MSEGASVFSAVNLGKGMDTDLFKEGGESRLGELEERRKQEYRFTVSSQYRGYREKDALWWERATKKC
jgi:hypothetical protein